MHPWSAEQPPAFDVQVLADEKEVYTADNPRFIHGAGAADPKPNGVANGH
jgi:hypothetical protein